LFSDHAHRTWFSTLLIKQIIQIQNLKDALTYAVQDIKDRWEWYKERFKKGMKE
jgi:hypothetical protein